ncbi:S8 family serine peptidase [Allorhizocola rhizosphaerae]|uniref:S8 family serine peptidase n=1 Tax=Allorhizocola rhizosphaerae TaxID=1872709 RepID=UPI000E3D2818|nr:S8 family serine peptidase [Allorhizocola rhizosphaerae]
MRFLLRVMPAVLGLIVMAPSGASAEGAWADQISDGQWYVQTLRLNEAHKLSTGKGVLVAVIDTGIDATHPDLAGSVVAGADTSRRGPGDGLTDDSGHGTAMAGLIVGHGQVRGVAPGATVMSIRAETIGGGSPTAVGAAINWAVEHDAKVISISLASPDGDQVLKAAVEKAVARDVVVVAGAGNTDRSRRVGYPAAYPGVVAVGGVNREGAHSPAAVSGSEILLSAPCDKISTPYLRHQRAVGTGTSYSAALVAGAAALLRAKFPDLPARDIVNRLTATAADKGPPGRDAQHGFGALDIVAALTADVALLPPPETRSDGVADAGIDTAAPVLAPGARFPVDLALIAGGIGLLLAAAVTLLVLLVFRQRRPSSRP